MGGEMEKQTIRAPRKLPRTSAATHFLRPMFIAAGVLAIYGVYEQSLAAFGTAAGILVLSILPAVVLHTGFRRNQERRNKIKCG